MDELNISVKEVCKTIHKSRDFVINAVQQGMMPGAVVVSKQGLEVFTFLERLLNLT